MTDIPRYPDTFNMASWFVDRNIEAGRENKTAIRFGGSEISYGGVARDVNRASNGLVALGLQPEQRVLTVLHDRPEFAYFWFGAIKAGGVATQINPLLPFEDFVHYLNYTKATIAAVEAESLPAFLDAAKQAPYLRHVLVVGEFDQTGTDRITLHHWSEWHTSQSPEFDPAQTSKDDPAVWLFTSGSTGRSKGAVHFHAHFPFNTEVYAQRFIGMQESDVTVSGPHLFFGYATGTNLMFPFSVGATTVLFPDRPTPERLFEIIEGERCTVFTSVPTLINKMLATPDDVRGDLSSLRFMWSAGEALPVDLHRRWDEAFGVPIIDGIGSAESFHIYISNAPDDVKPGSLGRLVPGYRTRLCDDDGNDVAQGDVGTLWVGGDSAALYYHADSAKSKEHLRGGWIVSGDKFRQDADGYWYYEGRGDDLIKSGGIYVSPQEVENCLMQHECVREVCVISRRDEAKLEKPLAIVVLNDGHEANDATARTLIEFAKKNLARYKAPHFVEFHEGALPRNDRDKIDRKALRAKESAK